MGSSICLGCFPPPLLLPHLKRSGCYEIPEGLPPSRGVSLFTEGQVGTLLQKLMSTIPEGCRLARVSPIYPTSIANVVTKAYESAAAQMSAITFRLAAVSP